MNDAGNSCRAGIGATLLLLGGSWFLWAADVSNEIRADSQLRAMADELARSKTLQINTLDKPYFIEYSSSDSEQIHLSASLGGLTSASRIHLRNPRVQVRVGDYAFDNTNFVNAGNPQTGLFPIDDDYQVIRNDLWLSTDGLYKAAADQIARKRAALREIGDPDKTPDFAAAKPVQIVQPISSLSFDQKHWEDVVRRLSAIFASHPGIAESSIRMRAIGSTYRLVNSEGSVVRIPQDMSEIQILCTGIAADGTRVWNHKFITFLRPSDMPKEDRLTEAVEGVAKETDALIKAPLAEDYTGPVLFEQEAAPEMIAQVTHRCHFTETEAGRFTGSGAAASARRRPGDDGGECLVSAFRLKSSARLVDHSR